MHNRFAGEKTQLIEQAGVLQKQLVAEVDKSLVLL